MNLAKEGNTIQGHNFCLANEKGAASIYVDSNDYIGVNYAANALKNDIFLVADSTAQFIQDASKLTGNTVIAGTIGNSGILDTIIESGKLDISAVVGKWESYIIKIVENPIAGVDTALVIAGSDKRGTIYGIYKISEMIGVSPWVWWGDSTPEKMAKLMISGNEIIGKEPSVKYRGIFFNDEAPCLSTWTKNKFGGFNHLFYEKVFELILRLKGNFLWPAMWGNAFSMDDPKNPKVAEDYGIVMGTSHHEPMMRAHAEWGHTKKDYGNGQWNYLKNKEGLDKFWEDAVTRNKAYENIITIGMRGDGDEEMDPDITVEENIKILTDIVKEQRRILSEGFGKDASEVPQIWALYKEVMEYYEAGMEVPEDVTLLFCDDNFGNVRVLPKKGENRQGGYAMYYHFDYVGGPRSYKWINTIQLEKIHEQMSTAYDYGVDRLWVVNMGDMKPMEMPMEYFLELAYDFDEWSQLGKPQEFLLKWSTREFGEEYAKDVAHILDVYTRINSLRKPESLVADTYSLTHYDEADTLLNRMTAAVERAQEIHAEIKDTLKDSFYQLVLYPAKASLNVMRVHIYGAKNAFYASHGLPVANTWGSLSKAAFDEDAKDETYYNKELANGKWDGIMIQPHFGQDHWRSSEENIMPAVQTVDAKDISEMVVIPQNSDDAYREGFCSIDEFTSFNSEERYVEVANGGNIPFDYSITTDKPWIIINKATGSVQDLERVAISVDWTKFSPNAKESAILTIKGAESEVKVQVSAISMSQDEIDKLPNGTHVEASGYITIEADQFSGSVAANNGAEWKVFENYGRTKASIKVLPNRLAPMDPQNDAPSVEYYIYTRTAGELEIKSYFAPTNNLETGTGLRYGIQLDDQSVQVNDVLPSDFKVENAYIPWEVGVMHNIRTITTNHGYVDAGLHKIKIYSVDAGVVLQRLVVDIDKNVRDSYLGPKSSYVVNRD